MTGRRGATGSGRAARAKVTTGNPTAATGRAGRAGRAVSALMAGGLAALIAAAPAGPAEAGGDGAVEASALGRYLAGRAARRDGDTAAAADFLGHALAEDPANEELQLEALAALVADGRMESGLKLAAEIRRRDPGHGLSNVVMAVAAAHRGDFEAAGEHADAASGHGIAGVAVPFVRAWARAGNDRFEAAAESLSGLEARAALAGLGRYHGALMDDLAANREPAEAAYEALIDGDEARGQARWYLAYGNFLERGGRADEAVELYRRALARDPDDAVMTRAVAEAETARMPERFVADARAGLAEALLGVADALWRDGKLEAATIYARLAGFLRPDFAAAQILLGRVLEWRRHWADAIAAYAEVDPKSPYAWEARLRTAANLRRLERHDEAVAMLQAMADAAPERTDALVALGDLYRSRERWLDAVAQYDRAVARAPEGASWSLLYVRGIALERAKQWDRAEADFLRALDLRPDDPLLLNYLGYSWVEQGLHLDRAREMIEKAVGQRPVDGYIVDSMGWVLYRLGDFEGAVAQLERAVELRPQDPVINDHLGDAYWRVGRRLEARFQWRRALTFAPEEELVPKIRRKLDEGLER